jgi:hypothetical protein
VRIRALFLGRLIQAKIVQLYYSYGLEGLSVLRRTVEECLTESVENVTILQLVSNRTDIENSIAGNIKNIV